MMHALRRARSLTLFSLVLGWKILPEELHGYLSIPIYFRYTPPTHTL